MTSPTVTVIVCAVAVLAASVALTITVQVLEFELPPQPGDSKLGAAEKVITPALLIANKLLSFVVIAKSTPPESAASASVAVRDTTAVVPSLVVTEAAVSYTHLTLPTIYSV